MDMNSAELDHHRAYFNLARARNRNSGTQIGSDKARSFVDMLRRRAGSKGAVSQEMLIEIYRDFLPNKRDERPGMGRLQRQTCALAGEGLGLLRELLRSLDQRLQCKILDNKYGNFLDDWEVNIAVAAVVQAIDMEQAASHRGDKPFAGGLAFASTTSVQLAGISSEVGATIARPRRPSLLPIVMDGLAIENGTRAKKDMPEIRDRKEKTKLRRAGHHFLAVTQEERKLEPNSGRSDRQFCVHTLDSSPERFDDAETQQVFFEVTQNSAANIGWSSQRNGRV